MFNSCTKEHAYKLFKGDGELVYVERPGLLGSEGWRVYFSEFALSDEYSASYSFVGLPEVRRLDSYSPRLYVPPSIKKEKMDEAILQMSLYADGELISEVSAPMKKWFCTSVRGSDQNNYGDGRDKSYYHFDIEIPANPQAQYELQVSYVPSNQMKNNGLGRFYLRIGGFK